MEKVLYHPSNTACQRLVVLVGLPGSGKSTLLGEPALSGIPVQIDDYLTKAPAPRRFTNSLRYSELCEALAAGSDCVISDVRFCESELRAEIATSMAQNFPAVTLEWVYFVNDPEACKERVKRRGRERVAWEMELIDHLSSVYFIPHDFQALPVPI
jgi:predicted kinase